LASATAVAGTVDLTDAAGDIGTVGAVKKRTAAIEPTHRVKPERSIRAYSAPPFGQASTQI
jgi:hypothetical protein